MVGRRESWCDGEVKIGSVDGCIGLFVMVGGCDCKEASSSACNWVAAIGGGASGPGSDGVRGRELSAIAISICSADSRRGFRKWRKYRFSTSLRFCLC